MCKEKDPEEDAGLGKQEPPDEGGEDDNLLASLLAEETLPPSSQSRSGDSDEGLDQGLASLFREEETAKAPPVSPKLPPSTGHCPSTPAKEVVVVADEGFSQRKKENVPLQESHGEMTLEFSSVNFVAFLRRSQTV